MNCRSKFFLLLFLVQFLIFSCNEDQHREPRRYNITGYVQKGPFILGTSVGISQLTPGLRQTGKTFSTEIVDNQASFELNDVELTYGFVQLSANGYYFDEVRGEVSAATLTLNALTDLTKGSNVNVNVLTHLEKRRVEYLVGEGSSFQSAKTTAQAELLNTFGVSGNSISESERLDIRSADQNGGILLAISVILQAHRSVGELAELLAAIADDMHADGSLDNPDILGSLRSSTKALDLAGIRTHLSDRYEQLDHVKTVPDFEKYVHAFLSSTGEAPFSFTLPATSVGAHTATVAGFINPNSLNTAVTFEYGLTRDYANTVEATPKSAGGHVNVSVNSDIVGLLPGTTYHFRVVSENSEGITYGDDMTFTTLGRPPVAVTQKATEIEPTRIRLHGWVTANDLPTLAMFEYGPSFDFGNSVAATETALESNMRTEISATISGLTTGQTYYFRVTATNELGTVYGEPVAVVPFHSIGSPFEGGLVAYVFQPGDPGHEPAVAHGLIVAPADIQFNDRYPHLDDFTTRWSDFVGEWYQELETGATGTELGDGKRNTALIVAAHGSGYYAAAACMDFNLNGYDDWFLPSLNELQKVNENRQVLSLFYGGLHGHWSSSEYSNWQARIFQFGNTDAGVIAYIEKRVFAKVRPFRYF